MGQSYRNCASCNEIQGDYLPHGYCKECGFLCEKCFDFSKQKFDFDEDGEELVKCIACEAKEKEKSEIEILKEENKQLKDIIKYLEANLSKTQELCSNLAKLEMQRQITNAKEKRGLVDEHDVNC